jgi:hypothetical protein
MSRTRITNRLGIIKTAAASKPGAKPKEAPTRNLSGFDYEPSKAKHLKRSLHNMNVALGTLLAAMKDLSLLRGSEVTPDGMLGGRGFVMPFKELKGKLNEAIGYLSDITDTIADELTNPKWKLSRKEVGEVHKEKKEIEETVDDAEDTIETLEAAKAKKNKPSDENEEKEIKKRLEQQQEETPAEIKEIDPKDVVDSAEAIAMKRYKDLLDGNGADKVASVLSKTIMANLVKGE